jgi:hypothetical protein
MHTCMEIYWFIMYINNRQQYNLGTNFVGSISVSTLRDTKSVRTIRTFKHLPLGSRHWLPFEAHFILAGVLA